MIGGGAECTRERREEGAAADIKFFGYESRTSSVICECYSRELRGCASSFFHTLSLSWCGVLAPPSLFLFLWMVKRDVAGDTCAVFLLDGWSKWRCLSFFAGGNALDAAFYQLVRSRAQLLLLE